MTAGLLACYFPFTLSRPGKAIRSRDTSSNLSPLRGEYNTAPRGAAAIMNARPTATSNKATFNRFLDATNTGDAEVISKTIDEVVESNVLFHPPVPIDATGAQALKRVWAVLLRAFPDIHVTVEDVIVEGDKLVCRNTVTGTLQGEYRGLQPTGKSVMYNEIFIVRFAGGRIAEIWGVVDVFSQMRQLGMIPGGFS
jgi:predicted ester cyclase